MVMSTFTTYPGNHSCQPPSTARLLSGRTSQRGIIVKLIRKAHQRATKCHIAAALVHLELSCCTHTKTCIKRAWGSASAQVAQPSGSANRSRPSGRGVPRAFTEKAFEKASCWQNAKLGASRKPHPNTCSMRASPARKQLREQIPQAPGKHKASPHKHT